MIRYELFSRRNWFIFLSNWKQRISISIIWFKTSIIYDRLLLIYLNYESMFFLLNWKKNPLRLIERTDGWADGRDLTDLLQFLAGLACSEYGNKCQVAVVT